MELQAIVLQRIRDYKRVREEVSEQGFSMSEAVQAEKAKHRKIKKTDDTEAADDEIFAKEVTPGTLRRGQLCFAGWSAKLALEFLGLVLTNKEMRTIKNLPTAHLAPLLEWKFGVKTIGEILDKVGTDNKTELAKRMVTSARKLERPLDIEVDQEKKTVAWRGDTSRWR